MILILCAGAICAAILGNTGNMAMCFYFAGVFWIIKMGLQLFGAYHKKTEANRR